VADFFVDGVWGHEMHFLADTGWQQLLFQFVHPVTGKTLFLLTILAAADSGKEHTGTVFSGFVADFTVPSTVMPRNSYG
jgi:hypothetical protein